MLSGELDEVMVVVLDNIRGMQSCYWLLLLWKEGASGELDEIL